MKIRKPRWETNLEEIIYGNIGGIIMSVDMFGITDSVMKHRDATLAEIKKLIHKELKKPRSTFTEKEGVVGKAGLEYLDGTPVKNPERFRCK